MSEDEDTASQDDPVSVELVEKIADLDIDDVPANHKWFLTQSNKYVQLKKLVDKYFRTAWPVSWAREELETKDFFFPHSI